MFIRYVRHKQSQLKQRNGKMVAVGLPGVESFSLLSVSSLSLPHIESLCEFSGMTLTWQSASTVDSVKRHALLMQLLKDQTLNFQQRLMRLVGILSTGHGQGNQFDFVHFSYNWSKISACCRSFCMTKKSFLRMETAGRVRFQKTSDLKASIADFLPHR